MELTSVCYIPSRAAFAFLRASSGSLSCSHERAQLELPITLLHRTIVRTSGAHSEGTSPWAPWSHFYWTRECCSDPAALWRNSYSFLIFSENLMKPGCSASGPTFGRLCGIVCQLLLLIVLVHHETWDRHGRCVNYD